MLEPGTRLGVYEIAAPLGAGGMGEVYRARDTALGRTVAIKILPEAFLSDPERVARFEREAQLLAAVNHPRIAAIYGLERVGVVRVLVLEYVDGETLAARLRAAGGPLPIDEALAIARQIADALQSAHDKGIVHRDLKPANIAITDAGTVKILDFGLAKLDPIGGDTAPVGLTHSPTLTFAATQAGVILGTAAYMSPEQAKGKPTDKRTDVWAFGCVLFEMLTGRRAFDGEDVTETIAAVVRGEPDWSALPAATPDPLRLLVRRCLTKDRQARIADIGVATFVLSEPSLAAMPVSPGGTSTVSLAARRRRMMFAALAPIAAVGTAAAVAWTLLPRAPSVTGRAARFIILPPPPQRLSVSGADRNVDVSADGSVIVYRVVTQANYQLFVRPIDALESRPLSIGTDAREPFFSPDGSWIGFFSGEQIKKIPTGGGPVVTVCAVDGLPRGGAWGTDDTIVFATSSNGGLMRVPAGGGAPQTLAPSQPDGVLAFPSVLPGARAVLFANLRAGGADADIGVLNLATGTSRILVRGGSTPRYADGWLVYAVEGALRAVRFDLDTLTISGEPIALTDRVASSAMRSANFAVSTSGTLVYIPAAALTATTGTQRSLVWVDREGHETPTGFPPRAYADPRLSPDGTRVAVGVRADQNDIWIGTFSRGTLTRLTTDPSLDQAPVWTPDGSRIVWTSQMETGVPSLYVQSADGVGSPTRIFGMVRNPVFSTSITPDGEKVVFWSNTPANAQDVFVVAMHAPRGSALEATPLLHSRAAEMDAEVSPDGRWLAYQSNESGELQIYVRPFPDVDRARWQVSADGGSRPVWRRDGKEIFYLNAQGLMTSAAVTYVNGQIELGRATAILSTRYVAGTTSLGLDLRGYDVSADGKRFLVVKEPPLDPGETQRDSGIVVAADWTRELNARRARR